MASAEQIRHELEAEASPDAASESGSEAAQRDLSDDESYDDDEDGSDNASDHGLKPSPRRRRRATPPPARVRIGDLVEGAFTLDPNCSYYCPHGCGTLNSWGAKTCRKCGLGIVYDEEQRRRRALNPPVAPKEGRSLMLCACCGEVGVGGDQHYLPASHARGPRSAEYFCRFCLETCPRCTKNKVLTSGDGAHLVCEACLDEVLTAAAKPSCGSNTIFIKQIILDQLFRYDLDEFLKTRNVIARYLIDLEAKRQVALRLHFLKGKQGEASFNKSRGRILRLREEYTKYFGGIPTALLGRDQATSLRAYQEDPLELLNLGQDRGVRFPSGAFDDIFSDIHDHLKTEARKGADPLEISKRVADVESAKKVVGFVASNLCGRVLKTPFHVHNLRRGQFPFIKLRWYLRRPVII